jgi:hypothetical protein
MTEFELFHKKKNKDLSGLEMNEQMEIGREFETPIAESIAKKQGWKIQPKKDYMRLVGVRAGSSFDYEIMEPFKAIFEIKNVGERSWNEYWKEDGENIEAPLNLEFQFQHELLVSGAEMLVVGIMVGGNRRKKITRFPDAKVHDAIIQKVKAFWEAVDKNIEPEPDFKRDAEFISKLFNKANKGEEVEADKATDELVAEYLANQKIENYSKGRKAEIKAEILMKVGSVSKINGKAYSISLGETKGSSYTVERKPGRNFRVFVVGEKEAQDVE